jgi:multidrug transporter EmrE-like cation transporter
LNPGVIYLAVSIVLGALGQVMFKLGVENIHETGIHFYLAMVKNIWMYLGFTAYGLSFFLWMMVLRYYDVSFARPFTSIGYILTYILAILLLGEDFTYRRVMGIVLITAGVLMIK